MAQLLDVFLEEPRRQFHVRELARLLRLAPSTTARHLAMLEKEGFVRRADEHGRAFFSLRDDSAAVRDAKIAHNIARLRGSGLIEHLVNAYNEPEAIVLFGSYGRGEENGRSDIDVAVLTPRKEATDLAVYEKRLKRPIQLFIFSREDVARLKRENKELLNNILNGRIIHGYWAVFR